LKQRALPAARAASQRCARNQAITHTLVMQPEGPPGFRFIPGQFGWLTVWESPFKASGHPFVLSSSAAILMSVLFALCRVSGGVIGR
jgi:predicted ferric reductase